MQGEMNTPTKIIIKRQDRIDYVLNGVCDYYGVTPNILGARYRNKEKFRRKCIAVKILRDIADISFKEINYAFGNKFPNIEGTWRQYQLINEELDSYEGKELKQTYKNILKHLGL
jgi:hypothetical protein